jgi:transcriptional regulator with XRE-family HTH domain
MTQRQLAAQSGIQQAEISRIEAGNSNPTLSTIAALTRALGAELSLGRAQARRPATGPRASGRRHGGEPADWVDSNAAEALSSEKSEGPPEFV